MLTILSIIISLGSLACWIMEIVAAFQKGKGPLMGILSIVPCLGLGGFIIGWIHAGKWGISKLMIIWTILIIASIIVGVMNGSFTASMNAGY